MSSEPIRIESAIKNHLAPALRKDGFTGSGRTFRRIRGDYIHVVNVQGSRYGSLFAINLAIQPIFITDAAGNPPNTKKIVESECEFRRRLSASGADQWWKYEDLNSLERAMADAANLYIKCGSAAFDAMSDTPSPIQTITAAQLIEGGYNFSGFGSTKVRMSLALARIREFEGKYDEAASFAIYGLENCSSAFLLKPELERIAALPNNSINQTG
ncbi:MAG: hypothetical protein NVSMB40_18020 [Aquirhabdus sp.]